MLGPQLPPCRRALTPTSSSLAPPPPSSPPPSSLLQLPSPKRATSSGGQRQNREMRGAWPGQCSRIIVVPLFNNIDSNETNGDVEAEFLNNQFLPKKSHFQTETGEGSMPVGLSFFIDSGIYHLEGLNIVFIDPVRILNNFYTRFMVSPSFYYSRFSKSYDKKGRGDEHDIVSSSNLKKRKRKKYRSYNLNERELSAEKRHQEARPFLLKAHEAFLGATDLLLVIRGMIRDKELSHAGKDEPKNNFVELGNIWQAPLYEISLCYEEECRPSEVEGAWPGQCSRMIAVPLFNNIVSNETNGDVEATFLNHQYILPKKSRFHTSDLRQIHNLIPAQPDQGFNLIVIDPPWENGSAFQKSLYPTLPNRHFLYLPVKQLAHKEGALVALWVTNREKLRVFVEKELFPAWGIRNVTQCYWLKVKADGSLIGELDLFHHRPYECLLLGYIGGEGDDSGSTTAAHRYPQNNQVFISIPGAYSRKPPLGNILMDYIPGPKPANCIDLFARELAAGWTSWGNEPLHFQDARYFVERNAETGEV